MKRWQASMVLFLLLLASVIFVTQTVDRMYAHKHDRFLQSNFPCREDEVLGYAPEFGFDRVGCMHIDGLVPLTDAEMNK